MGMPGSLDKLKDKEKVEVFQQRIQFQNQTIENQKTQVAEYKAESAQLKEQIDKFSMSIQDQTGVIADQQRTLKDQETTILQQQMSLSELQKRLIEMEKNLESANKQITGVDAKVREETKQLKSEIVELKKELEEKQAAFNKKILEREDIIKGLREENANLEKGVKELTVMKLPVSDGDASSLEKRVLDMESTLKGADQTVAKLEKELEQQKQQMQEDLKLRDVKIEEYERILKKQGVSLPKATNFVSDRDSAAVTLTTIFSRTKSNVMIFLPDITVLDKMDLKGLRPIIRVQLAVPVQKNPQLIDQLKMKSNLEIRDYPGDIWGIIRDNEEILLAPIGEKNEPSGLVMKGDTQIEMFGNVMRSTWTRLKRI